MPWNGNGYAGQIGVALTADEVRALARVLGSVNGDNIMLTLANGEDFAAFTRARMRIDAAAEEIINAERGDRRA